MLEQLKIHVQKNGYRLKCEKNRIKTLWEKNLCDFGFYNEFLDITPKA